MTLLCELDCRTRSSHAATSIAPVRQLTTIQGEGMSVHHRHCQVMREKIAKLILKQLLRDNLADLRREYRVGSLWLFGSYVRGEQHKRSDLDILVEFEEVPTLPKFISLRAIKWEKEV